MNPAIANTFKANGVAVSLAGGSHQFINQLIGVAFTVALAAIATFIILKRWWLAGCRLSCGLLALPALTRIDRKAGR